MTTAVLNEVVVSVVTGDPAAAICVRHLGRLGATIVPGAHPGADVVFVGDKGAKVEVSAGGTLVCVFESHRLRHGGLVASETTAQAAIALTDYIAAPGDPPARTGCDIGTSVAGFCATQAVLAWLYGGRIPGEQHEIRVSALRALSTLKTILWAARSRPDSWSGTHVRSRDRLVDSGYRTRDRRITLDFPVGAEEAWLRFARDLGVDEPTIERLRPRWYESIGWGDDVDTARGTYEERLETLTSEEAIALVRRNGGSSVPFQTPAECLAHPQSDALGLVESLEYGLPWRLEAGGDVRVGASREAGDPNRPLKGVRVVDFGVGGVGPFAATLLGLLGADVVKVEAPNEFILAVRPTANRLSTTYSALNQGKRSVALNLKQADDLALARALVADADVVIENFRPGALTRLGLGYEDVAKLNPAIVYCSATGFGWAGPLRNEPCTDPHMQAFSGFAAGNADHADGEPRRIRYYGFVDLVTSTVIVEAVCAALLVRAGEGGPVRVETSMLHVVTEALQRSGREALEPDGLFHAFDGYVALTCRDDEEWRKLTEALPPDDVLGSSDLQSLTGRIDHREQIRDALAEHLRRQPAIAWEQALGSRGIPCARVLHDDEVLGRKEFWDEGLLRDLPLPEGAPLVAGGPPWSLGVNATAPRAPTPGQDTEALRAEPEAFWRARSAI